MHAQAPAATGSHASGADAIFGHVLVRIDGTPESLVGAAQGGVLRALDGHLELLAVAERHLAATIHVHVFLRPLRQRYASGECLL